MDNVSNPTVIGILLVLFGLLGVLPFIRLGQIFEYPDILRQPTGDVLRKYHAGGSALRVTWFLFAMGFVPLFLVAPLLQDAFVRNGVDTNFLTITTIFGVVGAVFNIVGLMRWVFLVDLLANRHEAPETSTTARETTEIIFEAFHTYLGMTIGEFLGFAFSAVWGIMIGVAILQSQLVTPILGYVGIIASLGVLIGDLEFAGWKPAGMIVAISSTVLLLWAVALGIAFIIG